MFAFFVLAGEHEARADEIEARIDRSARDRCDG